MRKLLHENSGVALILTILIVSLIVTLTLELNISMRSNIYAAANLSDGIKLGYVARSGFNGAQAVLYEDSSLGEVDTLRETWAQSKILSENSAFLFDEGALVVEISDLSGKIQINRLVDKNGNYDDTQKRLLMRFLSSLEFFLDPEQAENLVDAIKDWIDADGEVTRFSAEDSYYQGLERPYPCKNAPFEFPEELLLVKGITEELFYGTKERPGIAPYISTYGDGKININTADLLVFMALSDDIDEERASDIIRYREDEDNDLSDPQWYRKVSGMADVSIPEGLLVAASTYFEITAEATKDAMSKRVTGVVERKKETLKILSWKVE